MSKRISVAVFVGHFIPAYRSGGPIRSLDALTNRASSDVRYSVFTKDRDSGDTRPFPVARAGELVEFRGRQVMYVDTSRPVAFVTSLLRFLRLDHDVYYFNSLWNRVFTLVPFLLINAGLAPRRPVVLAPRGELQTGALAQKSLKKRVALRPMRLLLRRLDATIHCTSTDEVSRARDLLPGLPVVLIPNTFDHGHVATEAEGSDAGEREGPLRVCFLARVHPHKNLLGAIEAVRRAGAAIDLRIIGPPTDTEYLDRCRALAEKLPDRVRAEFVGPVPYEAVPAALAWGDVLLLPTRGENFGHAIRDALAAGLCPLISDATPWTELAVRAGGAALAWDDIDGFASHLGRLAQLSTSERAELRRRVLTAYRDWAAGQRDNAERMDRLFLACATGRRPLPDQKSPPGRDTSALGHEGGHPAGRAARRAPRSS